MKSVELHTTNAEEGDIESFQVRMTKETMKRIDIDAGDFVFISGQRTTVARVEEPRYQLNDDRIAINPRILRNAGVYEKGIVDVSKATPKSAIGIILVPDGFSVRISDRFHDHIKRQMIDGPVMRNDLVYVSILARLHPFRVEGTNPEEPVIIAKNTEINIEEHVKRAYEPEYVELDEPPHYFIDVKKSRFSITQLLNDIKSGKLHDWLYQVLEIIDLQDQE